ncbi:TolB family protein [Hymenobacter humi]|uniref:TolB family protein n=1 Tax=Hymenobacter humi TaxID=1411620 RepID=A0ABW2U880_9BACT
MADLAKLTGLSDPQFSPDGKSIAVVVSKPDYADNRFYTSLMLVSVANGSQRTVAERRSGLTQPRWSPSGRELAFLAKTGTGKDSLPQLYIQTMPSGELRQVTRTRKGVQHYAWRPDGQALAYVTADAPSNAAGPPDKGYDAFEVGNNDLFLTAAPTPSHIWLVPAAGGLPSASLPAPGACLSPFRQGRPPRPCPGAPMGSCWPSCKCPRPIPATATSAPFSCWTWPPAPSARSRAARCWKATRPSRPTAHSWPTGTRARAIP